MKASKCIVVIACLCSLSAISQVDSLKFATGKPYPTIDADQKFYYSEQGELLIVKSDGKELSIQRFEMDSMKQAEQIYKHGIQNDFAIEHLIRYNNLCYLFYSTWDKENEKTRLSYRVIDVSRGDFVADGVDLIEVDGMVANSFKHTSSNLQKFKIVKSPEGNRLTICYQKKKDKKERATQFDELGFFIYDGETDLLWGKEVTLRFPIEMMTTFEYTLSPEDAMYAMAIVFEEPAGNKKRKFHYELLRLTEDAERFSNRVVSLPGYEITDLYLHVDNGPGLVLAGVYSDGIGKKDNADGIFTYRIDAKGEITDPQRYPIPIEMLSLNLTSGKGSLTELNDEAEYGRVILKNFRTLNNSGRIIVGEQDYTLKRINRNSPNTGNELALSNKFENLLVTRIGEKGEMIWMDNIHKKQSGFKAPGTMSYRYFYHDLSSNHYFFYLDHKNNLKLEMDKDPSVYQDGLAPFLCAVKINDKKGEMKKYFVLNMTNTNGMKFSDFTVRRMIRISDDAILIELNKGDKEDILVKVFLE